MKYISFVMLFVAACGGDETPEPEPECAAGLTYDPIQGECVRLADGPVNNGTATNNGMNNGANNGANNGDDEDMGGGDLDTGAPDMGPADMGIDCVDNDSDGACADVDCDDDDPRRAPGLADLCDEVDNDCDGELNQGQDCTIFAHTDTRMYRLDFFAGTAVDLGPGPAGESLFDIDTHPDGTLYAIGATVDGNYLHRFDEQSMTWTRAPQTLSFFDGANGFCIDNDGTAYATGSSTLMIVNLTTGRATTVGNMGVASSSGDCVVNKGNILFMSSNHTTPDTFVKLDGSTGRADEVGQTGYDGIWGLTAAWNRVFGLTDTGAVVEIDASNGQTTLIHQYQGLSFYGAASTPAR